MMPYIIGVVIGAGIMVVLFIAYVVYLIWADKKLMEEEVDSIYFVQHY